MDMNMSGDIDLVMETRVDTDYVVSAVAQW